MSGTKGFTIERLKLDNADFDLFYKCISQKPWFAVCSEGHRIHLFVCFVTGKTY